MITTRSLGHYPILGADSANPLIPHATIPGELFVEPAGLVWKPDIAQFQPFSIEWNSIVSVTADLADPNGIDAFFWGTIGIPVVVASAGLISGMSAFTCVTYIEPMFQGQVHAHFKTGGIHDQWRAEELARTIWLERADYFDLMQRVGEVQKISR